MTEPSIQKMMENDPIRASDVAKSTEKSPEELRREKAKKIAHGIVAKRAALRRAGADPLELGQSSPDLEERLAASLKKRDREVTSRHAASREGLKAAVAKKLGS
jgi:hypothetical protein